MNKQQLLETLGADARRAQDAALSTRPLPPLVLQRPSPRPVALPLAFAAAVCVGVLLWLRPAPAAPPDGAIAVTSSSVPAWVRPAPGARITATASADWVTLNAGTVALLADTAGPVPVLEVGAWQVELQPGAQAVVRWDPAQLALAVDVSAGELRVRGAGIVGARTLRAGEQLAMSPREAPAPSASSVSSASSASSASSSSSSSSSAASSRPLATPAVAAVAVSPHEPASTETPAPSESMEPTTTTTPPTSTATTWQQLAAAHRYTEALVVARQVGVDEIHATATADDLQLLADSARFSLDMDLATTSFEALRRRFAGTRLAVRASFYLARLASDVRHDDEGAAVLLREYLAGAPDDALSQEAAGRLVEVLERNDRHLEARDAAAAYLRRWPQGPHATLCRSVSARGARQ